MSTRWQVHCKKLQHHVPKATSVACRRNENMRALYGSEMEKRGWKTAWRDWHPLFSSWILAMDYSSWYWGSYKSGLVLAWGRNPIINLLAADTVLLSPCPACKAHLNTVNAAVPLHLTRGAAVQAQLCLPGSAARIKHTLCCMWQAPASSLCVGPTGTNLLPIELGCSFLQQEPGPNL